MLQIFVILIQLDNFFDCYIKQLPKVWFVIMVIYFNFFYFDRPVVYNKVINVLRKCNLIVKEDFFCEEMKRKRPEWVLKQIFKSYYKFIKNKGSIEKCLGIWCTDFQKT